ncbi:MAG: CvpA family protein [Deltaproteobacteria bacterium]|nr:CvpA family protein [Deltaproteobacteria bacterium]MBW2050956.1 CvpA family protein [Deltaproteobacteria bacterium]MBW2139627.1 CvpA family protein [Deltaproteobacteria bacterium]MBW2322261.1 CvpA family protein [Deltaproteobacteria bacterium]
MNGLDIVILVILCFFLLKGFIRGFIKEIVSIVGLLVAFFLAILYYPQTADLLEPFLDKLSYRNLLVLSFLSLFLATYIIVIVLGLLLDRFIKISMAKPLNIILGGVVGLIKGVFLASLMLIVITGFLEPKSPLLKESQARPYFNYFTDIMLKLIPGELEKYIKLEPRKLPLKIDSDLLDIKNR